MSHPAVRKVLRIYGQGAPNFHDLHVILEAIEEDIGALKIMNGQELVQDAAVARFQAHGTKRESSWRFGAAWKRTQPTAKKSDAFDRCAVPNRNEIPILAGSRLLQ